ncbi:MAG: major facilitator superfamily 1 [Phenylobacterium sp.]|nr:major facilitator superfamily 1 [Phenylobacterium sp.]
MSAAPFARQEDALDTPTPIGTPAARISKRAAPATRTLEQQVVAKFMRHIMPFLGLIYLIAYVDRQNVGFAKLQMAGDLHLSESAYGLGASLFFVGYFLFEVPSNLFLARLGARLWFARIMVSWGLVTVALGFTQNPAMFYALRFLLGVCEAGFFPGVLYLLTVWMPQDHRARMVGWFMIASVVANAVGAPLCGWLLDLDGTFGLRGWQLVFLATGGPAVLMGFVTLFWLPDGPAKARFYSDEEKAWLLERIATEDSAMGKTDHANPIAALLDRRILLLAATYIGFPLAAYGLSYWLPTVVKGFGVSNTVNGFLNIIPWVCTGLALWWVPRHSHRTGEKTWHIVGPLAVGAVFLILSVVVPGPVWKFAFLSIAAAGIFSAQPVYWTLPSTILRGASVAAGLAAINSVGNMGGFVAQNVVPIIHDATGSNFMPMLFLAACLCASGVMVFVVQRVLGAEK